MKKSIQLFLALAAGFIMLTGNVSAKDFKGVIVYKITIAGDNVADQMKAMMPKTMTMTIKGNIAKSEMITQPSRSV